MDKEKVFIETPAFTGRNVPIAEIARAIGKDAQYISLGLQKGILKFGYAMKMENSSEYNYYCPDKKVWEETGYLKAVKEISQLVNLKCITCIHKEGGKAYG